MKKVRSKPYRDAAKGEGCTVNLALRCNYDPATTVLAHLPDESSGTGTKPDDLSACFACSSCHDALDGRQRYDFEPGEKDWYMRRAQTRTLRRLFELGILTIKGA